MDKCPYCGAAYILVGRTHKCIPRDPAPPCSETQREPSEVAVTELVRVTFPIPVDMIERVDRYWHDKGLRSRSAAIRALLSEALQ